MWIPRPRLIAFVALTVFPVWTVAGLIPELTAIGAGFTLILIAFLVWDGLRGLSTAQGVDVVTPQILRLVRTRPGILTLELIQSVTPSILLNSRRAWVGLILPSGIVPQEPEQAVDWKGPDRLTANVPISLTAQLRGEFLLQNAWMSVTSPFGFWTLRRILPLNIPIRVQPDLAAALRPHAAFLIRGNSGQKALRQIGRGREFEKLRDYVPGDAAEDIHWKATAKRNHPVTKVYQIERTQEVYVLVDASRLSRRPVSIPSSDGLDHAKPQSHDVSSDLNLSSTEPVLEQMIRAALVLGAVAERQSDLFGLGTFSHQMDGFIRADKGNPHYGMCRELLVRLQSQFATPDFPEIATFLSLRLRRRALLMFLTDLTDPTVASGFLRGIDLLRHRHVVVVIQPQSAEAVPLFCEDATVRTPLDIHRAIAGHMQWQKLRELRSILQRRGVTLVPSPPSRLSTALMDRYFDTKKRQLL
jgi:uncharacterized protein (DUF58 family)